MEKQIEEGSKKKVMVIIDESEHSYHSFMWVLDNLKEFITDSPLVILAAQPAPNCKFFHGAQVFGTVSFCSPATTTIDLICSIQEKNKMILSGILEKAVNICASRGVKTETVLEAGEPYELICNAVQKNNIDVLVIGNTSINGALKRDFLGRLSKYCLNNARCHVLVVKNQDE
ncbi:ADENINE NUCLEOTIDE ALPHA HYDROLASES-LIKE SUPERFAMILY PROTEIN [Salix purpurea]|uniref:ADENINE NUCLEOTIDE ALPHA HYDROLASES-LIKE SUPERFAMILY PROTEIN n=1 Tax=Salix purpurea TaxID=77065 RepID=A0A9Q1AAM5_SALPP|nr:ADENINE NUCLEOTIDE ALPHA HYDROLASES-LIKE SUPERFAMILY PROTEIN [Salix purpurea]